MENSQLDALDQGIIRLLSKDGRMSFCEMAKQLYVTEKTIRTRYKNLVDHEWIKITGVVNPTSLGLNVIAMVQIKVDPGFLDYVVNQLVKDSAVRFVTWTSGNYSLLIKTYHSTYSDLTQFLKELYKIHYVQETNVIIQFEVYKNTID